MYITDVSVIISALTVKRWIHIKIIIFFIILYNNSLIPYLMSKPLDEQLRHVIDALFTKYDVDK